MMTVQKVTWRYEHMYVCTGLKHGSALLTGRINQDVLGGQTRSMFDAGRTFL